MSTAIERTALATLVAQIDDVTASLASLPGRTPDDQNIGHALLALATTYVDGNPGRMLLDTLVRRGVKPSEAQAVARALAGLAIRLGAYLGREGQ